MSKVFTLDALQALDPERFTERLGTLDLEHEPSGLVFHCRVLSTGEKTHLMGLASMADGGFNQYAYLRHLMAFGVQAVTPKGGERMPVESAPARLNGRVVKRLPDRLLDALGLDLTMALGQRLDAANSLNDEERARIRFFGGSEDSPEPAPTTQSAIAASSETSPPSPESAAGSVGDTSASPAEAAP